MVNKFLYRDQLSSSFGIYISGPAVYNAPERDEEVIEIPGRNGSLTIDNGRFKNIDVRYPAFIRREFRKAAEAARQWRFLKVGIVDWKIRMIRIFFVLQDSKDRLILICGF